MKHCRTRLLDLNYIELLRGSGCAFSVNRMLTAEQPVNKDRVTGLEFLEFNYIDYAGVDFYALYQNSQAVIFSSAGMISGAI